MQAIFTVTVNTVDCLKYFFGHQRASFPALSDICKHVSLIQESIYNLETTFFCKDKSTYYQILSLN